MTPMPGSIVLLVYGVLLIVGDMMGLSANSKALLMAGGGFGVLAMVAVAITYCGVTQAGLILGRLAAIIVLGATGRRFTQTRKFMPAGMTAVLSLMLLVLVVVVVLQQAPGTPVYAPGVEDVG